MSTPIMIPSKYQVNVFDFVRVGQGHAVIDAVAGSGKSTTIVKCLEMIPRSAKTIFLAFNVDIVKELSKRVPEGVEVKTLHGIGMSILRRHFGALLKDTTPNIVEDLIQSRIHTWGIEENQYEYGRRVKKLVDMMRLNLARTPEALQLVADKHDIEIFNGEIARAFEIIRLKLLPENRHKIDFTDMLFLPAIDKGNMWFPKYKYVFVDECQDLNAAQHELVKRLLAPGGRLIAVGDPRQAIYGFAGADSESFKNLVNTPNTTMLPLSVNYRCGKNIIQYVKDRFPNIPIEAFENAIDGEVNEDASMKNIQDSDYVLCRNTAPLVKMCLEFIAQQRKAYVRGGDIGKSLINLVRNSNTRTVDGLLEFMNAELDKILLKLIKQRPNIDVKDLVEMPAYKLHEEKIVVLKTIADACDLSTCDELCTKIAEIFADNKAGICFSSIHRAKGLEADHVHIIERDLMPSPYAKQEWQREQEYNLEYVAYTRAKKTLNFITDWTFRKQ